MISKHGFINSNRPFLVCVFIFLVNTFLSEACHVSRNERSNQIIYSDMTDPILCSDEEKEKLKCLNGGECIKPTADSDLIMCRCTSEFEGTNCDSKAMPDFESLYSAKVYAPLIAVTILGFFILVIAIACYAYKKHKRGYEPCKEETNVRNVNPHNYS